MLNLLATLLTLIALCCLVANVLGMPGNWVVVCLAISARWFVPDASHANVALSSLVVVIAAALLGELLEFAASALGASRMGASRRATLLSLVGSIAGALVGLVFGSVIPPPVLGNVVASLLLGAAGAFSGAVVGERWVGKSWDDSFDVGSAAFWGRLLGTVGKAVCGTIACAVFVLALWW